MLFPSRSGACPLRPSPLSLVVAALCALGSAHAQQATLNEVVVSASGFEQDLKQAPASISVITRDELQTRQFRDLAEALQGVEGIDVAGSTGKTGGLDISIRGMPSEYTLILVDGRRQNVAGDVTPNGFGAAHTSFMPPIAAIERIEVIRGPMSTLYGSDAMGGVVNIITRKVARQWGGSVSLQAGVPQDSEWGNQYRTNVYASGPIKEDLLGLAVRGDFYKRDASDWVLAPGATQPAGARNPAPAESRQHNLGARLSLTPNRQHDLWLDAETGHTWYNNEDGRLGNRDAATPNNPPGYRDAMRFNRDQVAVGHTGRLGFGTVDTSLMRTVTETLGRTIPGAAVPVGDPRRGTDRELSTTNTVLDSKLVAPLGEAHVLTVGGQWWDAKLTDGLLPRKHDQTMWSLFAEDEWRLARSLTATVGARYDHHSAFGGQVSPRGYLVWDATQHWTVKGGVSKGFRAPRLNQLIDGVSGVSGQGTVINIGNPNLKPETSTSTELGALFDSQQGLTASATLFHNKVKDKISSGGDCASLFISSCAANPVAEYSINVDEAKTWGLELSSRVQFAARWGLKAGYTWTKSEVIEGGVKNGQLANTARHIAHAQLDWTASDQLRVWLRGEYRGKSPRFSGDPARLTGNNAAIYQAVGDLKAYELFHLGGTYQLNKSVSFNANIFNLFDKDFRKYQQVPLNGTPTWVSEYFQGGSSVSGTTMPGRTFWISANVTF
ncbi:TonB-dependent receptor domain-containing protein [Pseudorhodoferax sp. Leaf274]|uniref:TonB-dependent receptor domain-containing protein n=1 Tax=Pseudorhodoferax sp. Leaf274 TaxID=1736318 RepID=UPI0007037E06|nr:TonB-dependent receptor [Pseudorhodoferax sp. Leaf274]KQP37149.1 TonB-dependent receptor [Pseudorhodoferax sp. Leaf274]